ncbi:MAG: hypothetical protein IK092_05835, partial [Muribaculaceae bacterium]|nr:hypothetical protein [Muribaculaceae bacterium]
MKTFLAKLLYMRLLRRFKLRTAPRWLVLLIDMLIVTFSFALVAISDRFMLVSEGFGTVVLAWAIIISVYFIVTYLTKSHTCVIRLSVTEDLYREFIVVAVSTIILLAINLGIMLAMGKMLFRFWSIVIIGAIAFAFLVVERLLIKHLYAFMTQLESNRKRVLVLGTSLSSLILANALKSEINGKYEPVGLLSIDARKDKNEINGFKVYSYNPDTLVNEFIENSIHALIFDSSSMHVIRDGLGDFFMRNNLAMLSINRVEEFELTED